MLRVVIDDVRTAITQMTEGSFPADDAEINTYVEGIRTFSDEFARSGHRNALIGRLAEVLIEAQAAGFGAESLASISKLPVA